MRSRSTRIAAVIVLAAATMAWRAEAAAPTQFVTGWIPNWSSGVVSDGVRALDRGGALFSEVSPFAYTATGASTIALSGTQSSLDTAIASARAHGLLVLPSITDGTGRLAMADILADPTTRTAHVAAITNLVVSRGYDGIDLDYEGFAFSDGRASWGRTQANWEAFIAELGPALHAQGKLLSVTVPPIWFGGFPPKLSGSITESYWVYSWEAMLPHIDRLRPMVYDWSVGTAGPLAPMEWVNSVIAYTKSIVPADQLSKVQMGVPAYGRSWATIVSGICPSNASLSTLAIQMENTPALIESSGATPVRDPSGEMKLVYEQTFTGSRSAPLPPPKYVPPADQSPTIDPADASALIPAMRLTPGGDSYTCTVRRTVYYPDAESVRQRAQAARDAGFGGITIWALGYDSADVWAALATVVP